MDDVVAAVANAGAELGELALELGNTYSPFGSEANLAAVVDEWYRTHGIESRRAQIAEGRDNVIARLPGDGGGPSILFNAHLDTEVSGPDFDTYMDSEDLNVAGGWREGDRLFGHTVLNDRACMSAMMIAGRALRDAGAPLAGDVWLTSVAGETGAAGVDEFQGIAYEGKGLGTEFLARQGVWADFGVVAEMTGFVPVTVHCGAAYYKITFRGRRTYTPFLERPDSLSAHPNAIVRAAAAVEELERWAVRYEADTTIQTPCGVLRPRSQVGAVRGGMPWRPNRASTYCALYMDVRTVPGASIAEITASLRQAVAGVDPNAEVALIMAKPGTNSDGAEPAVEALRSAHRRARGGDAPTEGWSPWLSMWRDTNVLNWLGIPTVSYGPGPRSGDGKRWMELDDLVDTATIYALTALEVAGTGAQ